MPTSPPLPPGVSPYLPIPVRDFDAAEPADAAAELMPCCASRRWITELIAGRPYGRLDTLMQASDRVLQTLDWVDVEQALRLEARTSGSAVAAAGVGGAVTDEIAARLAETKHAYERKFGYAFLVSATGVPAERIVEQATRRLTNDPFTERAEVAVELAKIVRLRLAKAFR
jgi:2-oxo-4-hydroxy-4-carboxy-5-ureidoimidazoline decarboxylase